MTYKIWEWFFIKNTNKNLMKDNRKMQTNIYGDKKFSTHEKKFHTIHYVFKYKFFVPLLYIGQKILNKYLVKKVDNQSHNRNIKMFDESFEEAIKKWNMYYLRNSGESHTRKSKLHWIRVAKNRKLVGSNQSLRLMKELVVTMALNDTAYREFLNIWMHEIAHHMHQEYTKPEYKQKDGTFKTGHLFYTVDPFDTNYYVFEKIIRYQQEVRAEEVEKLLNDYHLYHKKKNVKAKDEQKKTDNTTNDNKDVLEQSK